MELRPGVTCPACHAVCQDDDRFCERCGATLPNADREPLAPDRAELDLGVAAAVSDRGLVHRRNEDSFRLELGANGSIAAVICDGTSSASAGNAAAREAARTAGEVLSRAIAGNADDGGRALADAIDAAQEAVECVPWTSRTMRVDPSCTLVSALCRPSELAIGWVGDSRAYWIDADGPTQLTVDDSFAAEGIAKGLLTPEQAANSPFLHSITNWVGRNSPDRPPQTRVVQPERRGRLLLCTDGLWNYAATLPELSELLETIPLDESALGVAHALVDAALARGGHDNVTVAVIDVEPAG